MKKNGDQASGGTYGTRVQNVRAYLLKTAWTFVLLCGKHVKLAQLPSIT